MVVESKSVGISSLAERIGEVPDPEVPVLSIADLGILRSVLETENGVVVTITPTYSGCPAMGFIGDQIREVATSCGYPDIEVKFVLNPAWTTDWMSEDGKKKLAEFGIAPPHPTRPLTESSPLAIISRRPVACPFCESTNTVVVSEFSSTACKALYRCTSCTEPFDYFKEI